MADYLYWVLNTLLMIVAITSLVMWVRLVPNICRAGMRDFADGWVPAKQRERPFWGISEVFIMFGSMIVAGQLLLLFATEKGWYKSPEAGVAFTEQTPDMLLVVITISSLANCISIGLVLLWMWNIERGNIQKFGLSWDGAMVRLGLKSAVMVLPPVLAISAAVSLLVTAYEHQVLDVLEQLRSPLVFAVIFVGTAIVTPISEEILFRGLIQGGLQRFADRFVPEFGSFGDDAGKSSLATDLITDNASDRQPASLHKFQGGIWKPVAYWPVFAASFIFALMHYGQGAAPIPLFFLSVGLGYLYRQTGSLIPCIVVHMVLNSTTLLATFLG